MINFDDRLLDCSKIDANEFWLLMHIAKRINQKRTCFPKISTLINDTGWGEEKLLKVRKSLMSKGFISCRQQVKKGKFSSSLYKVHTNFISLFLGLSVLGELAETDDYEAAPYPEKQGTENHHRTPKSRVRHRTPKSRVLSINNSSLSINHECGEKQPFSPNPPPKNNNNNNFSVEENREQKKEKNCAKKEKLFRETKYVIDTDGVKLFENELVARNNDFNLCDLAEYHQLILNWSDSTANQKIDWIATAANWILRDKRDNKLIIKPQYQTQYAINNQQRKNEVIKEQRRQIIERACTPTDDSHYDRLFD